MLTREKSVTHTNMSTQSVNFMQLGYLSPNDSAHSSVKEHLI